MPKLTYNIELASKPDKLGRWSIMIRLHLKGHKPGRILTSVKLLHAEKYWKKPAVWGKWIARHVDKDSLNYQISNEHDRVKNQVEQWIKAEPALLFTPSVLAERFRAVSVTGSYHEMMLLTLEDAKLQAYTTWRGKRTALNAFALFAGKTLPSDHINAQLVRQFQNHLLRKKQVKPSSVNTYLDCLHSLHKAMLITQGVSVKQADLQSPWNDRERPGESRPEKSRLDESTIERVSSVKVKTNRRRMTPELSFHIWMLSHVLAGCRFSDVIQLRYIHFKTDIAGKPVQLSYEMMKTGFRINIPLFDEARKLLSLWWYPEKHTPTDYVLPYLSNRKPYAKLLTHEQYKNAEFQVRKTLGQTLSYWNQEVNKCLKDFQKAANLPGKLSTHTSRHSFADLAPFIFWA